MKHTHRFRSVLATIAVTALALAGCAGTGAGGGTESAPTGANGDSDIRVGVSMPTQVSERWIADGNAIKAQLEEKGYTVDLQFANDDIPTQTQQIDQMLTNGADVLVLAPIDGTALSSQLDAAGAANVPVISYDRLIRDNGNVDFYVSFDNYEVGVNQGIALLNGLGLMDREGNKVADAPAGPFNVELFAGSPDDNNATHFFEGMLSVVQPYIDNGTIVVKSGQTDFGQVSILRWSQETAQKRMEDLLTSTYSGGEKIQATVGGHDPVARGIITALQNAGYGPTIADGFPIVGGMDADIASVKLIQDGVQYSTIFKDTRLLAKQAAKAVEAFVNGAEPEANDTETYDNGVKVVPSYLLKSIVIYQDNIQKELVDSGYFTQEEIDRGVK
ncbi:multiple monosaccharide ABC transporter substrate-binding protein [Trueperella abortisuis]|uniref:multiple monosaccharide ABC transporter substrate-binding protein n=1 Tax=Trueperella abortisuis TaxID=445930 RepID=UPI002893191B|nr:multiple monosaccharide ABC transporter substrate-binding protein [Trueperella abortisuis]